MAVESDCNTGVMHGQYFLKAFFSGTVPRGIRMELGADEVGGLKGDLSTEEFMCVMKACCETGKPCVKVEVNSDDSLFWIVFI